MNAVGRICSGCGEIVLGPCECGQSRHEVRQRVYNSSGWRNFTRPTVLERDLWTCQNCGEPGNIVDHILSIEELLALGRDPLDPDECQTLCLLCSGEKDGRRR